MLTLDLVSMVIYSEWMLTDKNLSTENKALLDWLNSFLNLQKSYQDKYGSGHIMMVKDSNKVQVDQLDPNKG